MSFQAFLAQSKPFPGTCQADLPHHVCMRSRHDKLVALIAKVALLAWSWVGPARSTRNPFFLGTLHNAWSQVEFVMWCSRRWRGRAGLAFELGEPDVVDGTTAKFIHRGLSRASTGWPGCQDEAPDSELLAVLDQGLGSTRTR
jgi:hypothetical protein